MTPDGKIIMGPPGTVLQLSPLTTRLDAMVGEARLGPAFSERVIDRLYDLHDKTVNRVHRAEIREAIRTVIIDQHERERIT